MKNILENLKNPPAKYRPVPFWSWNAKLDTEETKWQVDEMNRVGMGGFFMHARGGLKTEYMGDSWLENAKAAVLEGDKLGMLPYGYDENGWPSGNAGGAVCELGVDYQQKSLKLEICDEEKHTDTTITNIHLDSGKIAHLYYAVNPFYVDVLYGKAIDEFLKDTHEKYKSYLGKDFSKMRGFFTDEPQVSRFGNNPWSVILNEEYEKSYGEPLLPRLYDLFSDKEEANETRFKYWKLVTRLFNENYFKKIFDWCDKNGVSFTGHALCEDAIGAQLLSNGAVMPHYEYLHIPGIDWLGRKVSKNVLTLSQITSACAQLGKKQILTESFALCGWNVSFEELKWIYEWQMVKGVNLLCQHLAGYSLAGIRKRDYPAGHFYQNPWWDEYKGFNDFVSRMGMLLSEGKIRCDVLVLHNISTGWINQHGEKSNEKHGKSTMDLMSIAELLDRNQVAFHFGDDLIMHKHARVEDSKLVIGKMKYSTVIVPNCSVMDGETLSLISEFQKNGGNLVFMNEVPDYVDGVKSDDVKKIVKKQVSNAGELLKLIPENEKYCSVKRCDGTSCDIQFAYREFDDFEMYYFVNTFADKENAVITMPGKSACEFDYMTGEEKSVKFKNDGENVVIEHTFEKMGSIVYFVKKEDSFKSSDVESFVPNPINDKLRGDWFIKQSDENVLTLDTCDCYFDGELYECKMYVGDIQEAACDKKKKVKVTMDFDVNLNRRLNEAMYLVVENPENYNVFVNGKVIEKKDCGYYRDKSFRKLDISGLLENGYNIITLECDFVQSEKVYEDLDNCTAFESVKNRLYYDMEIESIYLLGKFGVESDAEYVPAANDSYITNGKFTLTTMPVKVTDGDLTLQKFPFFCGSIKLTKTITLSAEEIQNRSIEFSERNSTVTKVTVNGKELSPIFWAPYSCDLSGLLKEGENVIDVEIIGNFRNMLGPHHNECENYSVVPGSFMKNSKIWKTSWCPAKWVDSYCFVKYGLFLK